MGAIRRGSGFLAVLLAVAASSGARAGIIGPGGDFAHALAIQADGKIVVAGSVAEGRILVARFDQDGRPDSSFGDSGRVVAGQPFDVARAVALDDAGRIVVAAGVHVFRYLSDGRPDPTFGDGGVVPVASNGLAAAAVQPDGRILVAGRSSESPTGFLVARLLVDGRLDAGFGTGGVVTTGFGQTSDARSVALEPDGRIVVGGTIGVTSEQSRLALIRYLPDGRLDTSFGDAGHVVADNCGGFEGDAVVVSPDGRITVAGTALERFLPDGAPDPAFADGKPLPLGFRSTSLARTEDGALVAAGIASDGSRSVVARFADDGRIDTGFADDGVTPVVGFPLQAATVDGTGNVVATGSTGFVRSAIGLERYLPTGRSDPAFAGASRSHVDELRAVSLGTGGLRTLITGERVFSAALAPDRRRLAFVRSVDGRLELDLIGVDGRGLKQLLANPIRGHELTAKTTLSWSPDGRRVAFDAWSVDVPAPCGSTGPVAAVYTVDVATGRLLQVATGAMEPRWSPDGRRLAFHSAPPRLNLFVANTDGSGRRAIGRGDSASWSPDGTRLAYVEAYKPWIDVIDRDGRSRRRVATGRSPVWAPTGNDIAYLRGCTTTRVYNCVRVVSAVSGASRRIARFHAAVGPVAWSADGTRIAVPMQQLPRLHQPRPEDGRWPIAVIGFRNGNGALYPIGNPPAYVAAPVQWGVRASVLYAVLAGIPTSP